MTAFLAVPASRKYLESSAYTPPSSASSDLHCLTSTSWSTQCLSIIQGSSAQFITNCAFHKPQSVLSVSQLIYCDAIYQQRCDSVLRLSNI
jgi:hypothetical protein